MQFKHNLNRNFIYLSKEVADNLKEVARDKGSFRKRLLKELITELSNEIPNVEIVKRFKRVQISFEKVNSDVMRKLERHATNNNTTVNQLITDKISRYLEGV